MVQPSIFNLFLLINDNGLLLYFRPCFFITLHLKNQEIISLIFLQVSPNLKTGFPWNNYSFNKNCQHFHLPSGVRAVKCLAKAHKKKIPYQLGRGRPQVEVGPCHRYSLSWTGWSDQSGGDSFSERIGEEGILTNMPARDRRPGCCRWCWCRRSRLGTHHHLTTYLSIERFSQGRRDVYASLQRALHRDLIRHCKRHSSSHLRILAKT